MTGQKKLNNGCLKVFHFLTLLYEDRAYYDDVVEIFKDEINPQQTSNNIQVTLNKYINTLKIFGFKVEKVKNQFKLLNSLFSMNYTLEDLKSINLIMTTVKDFPDDTANSEMNDFIKTLQLRMKSEDRNTLNMLNSTASYNFSFYYAGIRKQVEACEKYCKYNALLDIIYRKSGQDNRCKCIAKEVLYDSKNAYLKVHDSVKRQTLEIPITNILQISELPTMPNRVDLDTTVVFKLKGRLTKSYKLKENEHSEGYDENGDLIIVNKGEPFEKLFARLLRYFDLCEIVSPKFLREDMIKLISDTLENYNG